MPQRLMPVIIFTFPFQRLLINASMYLFLWIIIYYSYYCNISRTIRLFLQYKVRVFYLSKQILGNVIGIYQIIIKRKYIFWKVALQKQPHIRLFLQCATFGQSLLVKLLHFGNHMGHLQKCVDWHTKSFIFSFLVK